MLQHDLRTAETGSLPQNTVGLVAWCICGAWSREAMNFDHGAMARKFLAHLEAVKEIRVNAYNHVDTIARYLYLTP